MTKSQPIQFGEKTEQPFGYLFSFEIKCFIETVQKIAAQMDLNQISAGYDYTNM